MCEQMTSLITYYMSHMKDLKPPEQILFFLSRGRSDDVTGTLRGIRLGLFMMRKLQREIDEIAKVTDTAMYDEFLYSGDSRLSGTSHAQCNEQ